MDEQNFGQGTYVSESNERTYPENNGAMVDAQPGVAPDAALIDEWPVQKSVVSENTSGDVIIQETSGDHTIIYKENVGEVVTHDGQAEASPAAVRTRLDFPAPVMEPHQENGKLEALLDRVESEKFRVRWNEIQSRFVDEPRAAVQEADQLVVEVTSQITRMFASENSTLEGRWKQGSDTSTEDLRTALQRYRSFFNRLVV